MIATAHRESNQAALEARDRQWCQWMLAAQEGDGVAYERLLREVTPFIRALVRQRLFDADRVEDVVQESLLTVHRVRHTYDPARPFSPWLAAIVARRGIDELRRRGRIDAHEQADETGYETFADAQANIEADDADSARQLEVLLKELPAGQRRAVELLKLRELSLAEASAVSGQSVASLKVSVHRALKALNARLAQRGR